MRLMLLLGVYVISGCGSTPPAESPPWETVSWANHQIDAQRTIKRHLLRADPIERRIEDHLNRDPRVQSARFAILISHHFISGESFDEDFSFTTVVECREPMSDDELSKLLEAAGHAAGVSVEFRYLSTHRDGNTWSSSGSLTPTLTDNPDLSVLSGD